LQNRGRTKTASRKARRRTRRGDPLKKTVLVAAAALAASVMTFAPGVALAQEPSCAEAQLAFQRAQAAFDEAESADKAAADAKAADEELERAKRALDDAREAALSAGVPVADQ